jgi:hypothetical protein
MKKRLQNLRRIVAVKERQKEAAGHRLVRLEAEQERTRADQEAVVGALNAEAPLHGLFVEVMARHLRRLAETLDGLERQVAAQEAALRRTTGELRQTEKLLGTVDRRYVRHLEEQRLADLIESTAARRDKPPESFDGDDRLT